MNINWYPGHMVKTKKLITENIKLVDVVIELLDARIPNSSRNPQVNELTGNKPRIIVLNKFDLADASILEKWKRVFEENGDKAITVDSISGKGIKEVISAAKELTKEKLDYEKSKGRLPRAVRAIVVGIPNVGKSSFINKLVGKASAKTGDKPGVTRGKQWVRISNDLELLDMPGILWPKLDEESGLKLAFTGAISDDTIDVVILACKLLEYLQKYYPSKLCQRFKLEKIELTEGLEILKLLGKKRGAIVSGGEIDLLKISQIVLDEFRGGKIGQICLEKPE